MGKSSFLIWAFLLSAFFAFSQESHYVVYFKDKDNSQYSIENPEAFLSPKAIQRKAKYNIPIDQYDLPVSRHYVNALIDNEVNVMFTSRWFNAALVEIEQDNLPVIQNLSFVDSIHYVAPMEELANSGRTGRSQVNASRGNKKNTYANLLQNRMMGIKEMHEEGYTGDDILIAVFDSGFDLVDESSFYDHIFKESKILFTRDFVGNSDNVFQYDSHGSKALSTIAAFKADEYSGVAYDADFVLCVTEDVESEFKIEEYNWLLAAELADSLGVDIISSSLAYTTFDDPDMDYTYKDLDGKTTIITKAANIAARKGMIVVTSAGNDGNKTWKYLNAPADADSVLAIGAVTPSLERSSFSSYGPTADGRIKPDLCALGSGVSVVFGENIGSSSGTSFSTPLVAGLAAGFWQANRDLSSFEVMEILKSTASNKSTPDTLIGYGVPNFSEANNVNELPEGTFIVYPNPTDGSRAIKLKSEGFLEIGNVSIKFANFKGIVMKSIGIQVFSDSEELEIDISDLVPGYYLAEFVSKNKSKVVKLVVR